MSSSFCLLLLLLLFRFHEGIIVCGCNASVIALCVIRSVYNYYSFGDLGPNPLSLRLCKPARSRFLSKRFGFIRCRLTRCTSLSAVDKKVHLTPTSVYLLLTSLKSEMASAPKSTPGSDTAATATATANNSRKRTRKDEKKEAATEDEHQAKRAKQAHQSLLIKGEYIETRKLGVSALCGVLIRHPGTNTNAVITINDMYRGFTLQTSESGPVPFALQSADPTTQPPSLHEDRVDAIGYDCANGTLYVIAPTKHEDEDVLQIHVIQVSVREDTKAFVFTHQASKSLSFDSSRVQFVEGVLCDPNTKTLWVQTNEGGYKRGVYGFRMGCFTLVYSANQSKSPLQAAMQGYEGFALDESTSTLVIARTHNGELEFHPFQIQLDGSLSALPVVKVGYKSCSLGSTLRCPFTVYRGVLYMYDESGHCDGACILAIPFEPQSEEKKTKDTLKHSDGDDACAQDEYTKQIKLCDRCASKRSLGPHVPYFMLPSTETVRQLQFEPQTCTLFVLYYSRVARIQ